jgi:hypothetical protein
MVDDRRGERRGRRERERTGATQVHWKRFVLTMVLPERRAPWGPRSVPCVPKKWLTGWGRFNPVRSLRPRGRPQKPEGLVGPP